LKSQAPSGVLERAATQVAGVLIAVVIVAAPHWQNDGLWLQGDAPRNVVNGFFFWDLLTSRTSDPLSYSLSYYARYPVITPVAYPPLFYILEGAAFWALIPSPYVGKVLVLTFSAMAGIYTLAWGRRWIGPMAGWAGACTILLPGFLRLSNGVLLNVPGTALGFATLYHFRLWLDGGQKRHLPIACGLGMATLLTYYPAGVVLPIALVWMLGSSGRSRSLAFWVVSAILLALLAVVALALPVYLQRHIAPFERLFSLARWEMLARRVWSLTGALWYIFGVVGLLLAFVTRRSREWGRLATAYTVTVIVIVAIRWIDPRYALILGPLTVLAAFVGLVVTAEASGRWRSIVGTGILVLFLTIAGWSAIGTTVPVVSGFNQIAEYLRQHGENDAVMYSGRYDGVFGAYLRALDPLLQRRLVLWRKFASGLEGNSEMLSPAELTAVFQHESGCRWVAVEVFKSRAITFPDQTLRLALQGPEFEFVRSFPVTAEGVVSIDLYRFRSALAPPPPMDLTFQAFSRRVFRGIEPIPSRRNR
jgi:hypothetical protein